MTKRQLIICVCMLLLCPITLAQTIDADTSPTEVVPEQNNNSLTITDLSEDVIINIIDIYELGQSLGNRTGVFSKVGDSLTVSSSFLYPFGVGRYALAGYDHLQPIIETYRQDNAHIGNSFINRSVASHEGWAADDVLDPEHRNPTYCDVSEAPLLCEYRLTRPSIALIMFGTNDVRFRETQSIIDDIETITYFSEQLGIIPILYTIPNQPDATRQVAHYNQALRQFSIDHNYPLIDLFAYTNALPNAGLTTDNIHLSSSPLGMTGTATFDAYNLQYGYVVRNLLTLDMLYQLDDILTHRNDPAP